MGAMAAPLPKANLDAWRGWTAELSGPRKAEFEDMNSRHGITDHRAYLQPVPDGNYLVIVVTDGPGGDGFLSSMAASDNEFDKWFLSRVAEAHGVDMTAGAPPSAERVL